MFRSPTRTGRSSTCSETVPADNPTWNNEQVLDLTGPVGELREWGWVFGDLELSGVGWYHAGHRAGGILHS